MLNMPMFTLTMLHLIMRNIKTLNWQVLLPLAVVSWPANMNVSTSLNISSLESPVPSSSYSKIITCGSVRACARVCVRVCVYVHVNVCACVCM